MSEPSEEVKALARAAGLDIALAEFPSDIAAAASAARTATHALNLPDSPAAEPWPPMQIGFPA